MEEYQDHFLQELSFPVIEDVYNQNVLQKILTRPSVSVHIRRGDYVNLGLAMKTSYYEDMVKVFQYKLEKTENVEKNIKNWEVFVFSDDIAWCKENYKELGLEAFGDITYVEGNIKGKNYIDMQLMSKCEGMMISNSAFCYLAALLNTRKKIVVNATTRNV